MLLIQNGLFRIEHQAIGRTHEITSIKVDVTLGARYQSISAGRKPTFEEEPVREVLR